MNWEDVRIQAAIAAMQGIQESGKLGNILELEPSLVADLAVRMADALVKRLKETVPARKNLSRKQFPTQGI